MPAFFAFVVQVDQGRGVLGSAVEGEGCGGGQEKEEDGEDGDEPAGAAGSVGGAGGFVGTEAVAFGGEAVG